LAREAREEILCRVFLRLRGRGDLPVRRVRRRGLSGLRRPARRAAPGRLRAVPAIEHGRGLMAAKSIWNGQIRLGTYSVPVKLYSAVLDRNVHFHLLHAKDKARVRPRLEDPENGEEVPRDRIRKGFEAEPGVFVLVDGSDLEAIEPKQSRDIEITRFVDPAVVGPEWYERPYFVGPSGGSRTYASLVAALTHSKKEAIARWTMRKRTYVGALRAKEDRLLLV